MPAQAHYAGMATPLRAWVDEQRARGARGVVRQLHEDTKIPLRSLYRYIDGERCPRANHALQLSIATGGAVSVEAIASTVSTKDAPASPPAANGTAAQGVTR